MEREVAWFRAEARRLGLGGVGRRYPAELKEMAVRIFRQATGAGSSLEEVAVELGVSVATLSRWLEHSATSADAGAEELYEVVVEKDDSSRGLTLVSPSGYRVEGLSLGEASSLLESLG